MKLNDAEIKYLQEKYRDLMNYQSKNPFDPIDPLTYVQPDGDTLLHIAARRGDLKGVELLLKAGLDVNQPGDMGYTALHYAYWKTNEGAYMEQKTHVIQLLLEHGASTEVRNAFGQLPMEVSED